LGGGYCAEPSLSGLMQPGFLYKFPRRLFRPDVLAIPVLRFHFRRKLASLFELLPLEFSAGYSDNWFEFLHRKFSWKKNGNGTSLLLASLRWNPLKTSRFTNRPFFSVHHDGYV
jgi:hypothetical protein